MIYEQIGEYTSRKADISDLEIMYSILSPYMLDENEHQLTNDMYLRKLRSLLKFYIENKESVVAEFNGSIVACATGTEKVVLHLANSGDIFSMVLLFKTLLCDVQSLDKESYFETYTEKQFKIYDNIKTTKGKAIVFKDGVGVVSKESKQEILDLFELIKDQYA